MTKQNFEEVFTIGGKSNSLGKTGEVIEQVLSDKSLLPELYSCMFNSDPWVRMRAADAFEKICRAHPEWITPYIEKLQSDLSGPHEQPSIKWHLAQIYEQVPLTDQQKEHALNWLTTQLSSTKTDWIVVANCMKTLLYFAKNGDYDASKLLEFLRLQTHHHSKSVVKKANKYIDELAS